MIILMMMQAVRKIVTMIMMVAGAEVLAATERDGIGDGDDDDFDYDSIMFNKHFIHFTHGALITQRRVNTTFNC